MNTPEVIFEDNHLLVVNKPSGMGVQGDSTGDFHLLQWAAAYLKTKYNKPGEAFVGLIHRIDRPVSGVVVLAKTSKALTRMNELFRNRLVKKVYHAVTTRPLPNQQGFLENFMDKDGQKHRAIVYRTEKPGSKKAILEYKLLKNLGEHFLWEILPQSGRFHQIRAQMAFNRAPLVGDLKYGYPFANENKSICLHAFALEFKHPVKEETLRIEAKPPQDGVWALFV